MPRGQKRRSTVAERELLSDSPEPETQRRRTDNVSDEEDFEDGAGGATTQGEGLEDMAKKLVRLALACEFNRKPIRRADISEKVLGGQGRQFKKVFNQAQMHLEQVFGMKMIELPAKDKVTLQQRRAAQKSQSQTKATMSWMLTSILPSDFRNPAILQPASAPTPPEESKYTAVYTVLVSLILLNGGTLPDAKMERSLRRLMLEDNTPVAEYDKTEKLMKRLEREGYIIRIKESTGTGEDDIFWAVGPRGKIEVGDDGVRGLVQTVFGDMEEHEAEELERKVNRSLGLGERASEVRAEAATVQQPKPASSKRRSEPARENDDDDDDEDDDDDDD